ncbi:hypothetical protein G7Y89_g7520 [Cudoniella acicularis]|uniref:Thiaminase-2/PQQC domain-containing protein n=1 Tax=Cudoniella acicularis TaxID=354080 RepID=A0A8H4RKB5_9HELO|nr:hypothetical protein G7Y89_g7520 [Cudoniella acicularis]
MSSSETLTQRLLSLNVPLWTEATQDPFLEQAGKGTLEKSVLEKWLRSDRAYARAYVRFAGRVIAEIAKVLGQGGKGGEGDIVEGTLDLFLDALVNVRKELKFFEDVATRYYLDLSSNEEEEGVEDGVRMYRELFEEVSDFDGEEGKEGISGVVGILQPLVLLWGTEKCYLEAWRFAASFTSHDHQNLDSNNEDADGGALRKEFIPNWTSDEFAAFVQRIEGVVEEVWECVPVEKRQLLGGEMERLWERILRVEGAFWPRI